MTGLNKQQLSSLANVADSNIFPNRIPDPADQFITYTDINFNNNIESTINDDLWDELVEKFNIELLDTNSYPPIMSNFNDISKLQNTFQYNLESTNINQLQLNTLTFPQNFVQTSILAPESTPIDSAILTQSIVPRYHQSNKNVLIPQNIKVNHNQSTSVTPIVYMSDRNASIPCDTKEIQHDLFKSKKIQIKCQPRSKFRPRTQNESKNSSHYLRCDEDAESEYPAIYVPQIWAAQSEMNVIEVALLDIEKQPHPYTIDNKNSKTSFDDGGLIMKQNEVNVLYFRLTNEDFVDGFKAFMIEFIKSKQDDFITKKLIQLRKLDQSMLRFTRIYRDKYGKYQRDIHSQEYSCIMTENYGDVTIEHVGPRYGPMTGQEMLFIVLRGRVVKDDLSVIISEQTTNWCMEIKKFLINGSFIYFPMPIFPHPQMNRVNVNIHIYFKKDKIHESTYLYTNLLDQELTNSNSDVDTSMISNNINYFQFDMETGSCPIPSISQKTSKNKPKKRLNSK